MPTNCGDLWFLCGPVYNLTSPFYWISSVISTVAIFQWGYHCGKSDAAKAPESEGDTKPC